MPLTFKVAAHPANPFSAPLSQCKGPVDLLNSSWGEKTEQRVSRAQVLQSGPRLTRAEWERLVPEHNGFVNTVVTAYNTHKHLVLRPDDVWIAILGQFNFYVNAHAEELRKQFVAHEDKKTLVVRASGTRFNVDFGSMARQMANLIHENVVDKDLKDWILPDYSTTTHNDTVVCAVLMMATLKAYFSYVFSLDCGIPSVTLEGTKADWEKILKRVDKLDSFGEEPKAWAGLLRPILKRFVAAFDGPPDLEFWGKICDYRSGGSGPDYISGWITAFCVWTSEGKWLGPPLTGKVPEWPPSLKLDDARYTTVDVSDIPPAFCEVDVLLDDNGEKFDCMMVSGHVATRVLDSDKEKKEERDKVAPFVAWFMFVKDTKELQPADYERARWEEEHGFDERGSTMASGDGASNGRDSGQVGSKFVNALRNSRLGRRLSKISSPK